MKKSYYVVLGLLIFAILLPFGSPKLRGDKILDKLPPDTPLPTLYYTDLSGKKVSSFNIRSNQLKLDGIKSISYTEGFMPKSTYTFYENLLKASLETFPATGLYNFYEDTEYAVLAYGTALQDVYIIEKNTARVHPLHFPSAFDLGPMYIFHIQKVGHTLMLLAGESESYDTFLYKIHLPTFEVVDAIRLTTHPSALSKLHSALTSSGIAAFINGNGLKLYDLLADTYKLVPLDYLTTAVLAYEDKLIALGKANEILYYTVLDSEGTLLKSGKFTLPSTTSNPVDFLVYQDMFYLATYDPKGTRYTNYLMLYDLKTGEMLYSLGINPLKSYALLDIVLP